MKDMPSILNWHDPWPNLERIHDGFVLRLSDALGTRLGELSKRDTSAVQSVRDGLLGLSDAQLLRVLTAPEISYRLLWPEQHRLAETAGFLRTAIDAELRLASRPSDCREPMWTALGDARVSVDAVEYRSPSLGGIPLDFESPYAVFVDVSGLEHTVPTARIPLWERTRQLVCERLEQALAGIGAVNPAIEGFVTTFTKSLVLLNDTDSPESFSSGSSAQYIGRTVLANAHLPAVSEVDLAEALVHEAVHSVLFMEERAEPWVLRPELYAPTRCTVSPWSGNVLPLRPLLQAAFVWYALVHFWCQAFASLSFDRRKVRTRIAQAASGFIGDRIARQIDPFLDGVSPTILLAIEQMRIDVVECLEGMLDDVPVH
jgi:hypothetical protein